MKIFEHSKTTLITGCTNHPGDFKYCSEHRNEKHPAVSSNKLSVENRRHLEAAKDKNTHYREQDFTDNVYIVEGIESFQSIIVFLIITIVEILDSKTDDGLEYFKIKWEDYDDVTWEPESNLPIFMVNYYKKTGNGKIPTPRIASTRKKGTSVQFQLVWDEDESLTEWVLEKEFFDLQLPELPESSETRTCNTRKDKDRRKNRHTCGIFIG